MNGIIKKTIENLKKNNINSYYIETKEEIATLIESLVPKGSSVAVGGSVTLNETGVLELLRNGNYNFYDRYAEGLTAEEIREVFIKSMDVDAYFSSSNAVTQDGELYNVDGNANRVAAISFGPKKVYIIVGVNKIVANLDEAVERVKTIAAPKNAQRLNCKTYCFAKGHCVDKEYAMGKGCDSPDRICRHFLVTAKQKDAGRINVIFVNEELGY